jgi:hypothetical protein
MGVGGVRCEGVRIEFGQIVDSDNKDSRWNH